ncbi:MAG: hypothetical protein ACKO0U_09725, partial [Gammaproteobacteria bacterium]
MRTISSQRSTDVTILRYYGIFTLSEGLPLLLVPNHLLQSGRQTLANIVDIVNLIAALLGMPADG